MSERRDTITCSWERRVRPIQQPGPRPLRSEEEIMGLSSGLTAAEQKQLKEGNLHTLFSAQVMTACYEVEVSFTGENPEPLKPVSIFNTPAFKEVAKLVGVTSVDFDQCRTGSEAKKPTRLLYYKTKHLHLSELRCNHEPKEWIDSKGLKYRAPHERVAQRKGSTKKARRSLHPKLWVGIHLSSAKCSLGTSPDATPAGRRRPPS